MKLLNNSLFILLIMGWLPAVYAETSTDKSIYQYKENGVTEFSDIKEVNKAVKHTILVEQPSKRQKQQTSERMRKIRQYNEEYNKELRQRRKASIQRRQAEKKKHAKKKSRKTKNQKEHDAYVSQLKGNNKRRRRDHLIYDRKRESQGIFDHN
jgi:hypothetical protein